MTANRWSPFAWLRGVASGSKAPQGPGSEALGPEAAEVQRVLDELAPALALDGGAVELEAVVDGWVHLRWAGACRSCSATGDTLRAAIEPRLRARLPWVRGVRAS